jgi:hypothetical protein
MKQLDKVDEFLDQCRDGDEFVRLTAAKEKYWNLVFPNSLPPSENSTRNF